MILIASTNNKGANQHYMYVHSDHHVVCISRSNHLYLSPFSDKSPWEV